MAKTLLVDTNFSSAPIYRALLAAGHEVHVVGRNPDDCLAKQALHYWHIDYSDTEALSDLLDTHAFDHLVPGCTDRSYESTVMVGRGRFAGLDTPSAMAAISHKGTFRRLAADLGLPIPKVFANPASAVGHRVIVKPVDSFSGKGITVLLDAGAEALETAVAIARDASPSRVALIEEFVEGQLYSHSAFLLGRKVLCDFLVREDGTANRFVVDTSRVLDASEHTGMLKELRRSTESLAEHLGLSDGLLHTQFIADDSRIWLIELTRRCPGDLYSQLIELSTGYPYAHSYAMPFLGHPPLPFAQGVLRPIMRHTISLPGEQVFDHLRFLRPVEIRRFVPLCSPGDLLRPSPLGRAAVIFCHEPSQKSLDDLYSATLRRDLYTVSDGN